MEATIPDPSPFRKKARRGTGSFDPLNQRPHNVKNVIVRFGLYSGLTASILFLGPFVINPDQAFDPANMVRSEIIGYAAMILSMTLVYFGVRAHRNKLAPQVYPFGDAFRAGILITLISVIVFYFGNVILYEVINPDFLEEFFVVYRQYKIDGGASDTEIARMDASYTAMSNGWLYALVMASTTLMIGIVITLISAIVLKRTATA